MSVDVVSPEELAAEESTPGVSRRIVFETENNVVVQARVAAGTTTDWHYHGDRHVYGYHIEGSAAMEYGPNGQQRAETTAGDCFYLPPGTVHRDVNPGGDDAVVLVSFVGSGPVVVNVDGPGSQ